MFEEEERKKPRENTKITKSYTRKRDKENNN